MTAPDVVVIGAGAIGAGCAYELAGAGARVTVIERAMPGAEASGASAGILSSFNPSRADALASLCRLSRDLYEPLAVALADEAGIDVGLGRTGHLDLCMNEEEVLWARRVAADPAQRDERLGYLTAEDLRREEPAITPDALGALHIPRSSWVDNGRLVAALVRAGERRGVRYLLDEPVLGLVRQGSRVFGVATTRRGSIPAGAVVLAAGAWSGQLAGGPAGLAVRPVKGQMLALGNAPAVVRHVIFRGDTYLVPRHSGECLVGATVEEGLDDHLVTPEGLRWLLDETFAAAPGLRGQPFLRAWAGLRPATEDGLPAVGPWPDVDGLVVATGHYRSGILLMPVTARIVREWVVDGRCSLDAARAFLPDRLARGRLHAAG